MTAPVTRCALGPTVMRPVEPETSASSCFSMAPLPPVNGSPSATTFQGPVSAQAIDSARNGSSRTTRQRSGTSRLARQRLDLAPRALGRQVQVAHHGVERHGPALLPRERDLAHEAVGCAVEQLLVLDEQALEVGAERARNAHRRLHGDGARVARPQVQHDPAAVLAGLGDVGDHDALLRRLDLASPPALAKPRPRSANDLQLVLHQPVDGAGREAAVRRRARRP